MQKTDILTTDSSQVSAADAPKGTIFLVESNADVAATFIEHARQEGREVVWVEGFYDALQQAQAFTADHVPSAIVIEGDLPNGSYPEGWVSTAAHGFKNKASVLLTAELSDDPLLAGVPKFIQSTTYASHIFKKTAEEAGAKEVVPSRSAERTLAAIQLAEKQQADWLGKKKTT